MCTILLFKVFILSLPSWEACCCFSGQKRWGPVKVVMDLVEWHFWSFHPLLLLVPFSQEVSPLDFYWTSSSQVFRFKQNNYALIHTYLLRPIQSHTLQKNTSLHLILPPFLLQTIRRRSVSPEISLLVSIPASYTNELTNKKVTRMQL